MNYWILLTFFFIHHAGFAQQHWKLKKDANDIKIFTRATTDSNINEFKAETIILASLDDVLNELLSAPPYFDGCEAGISYYVESNGDDKHIFYAKKDLPWPLKDRDIVTQLTVKKINRSTVKLCLEGLPNELPLQEKTIRIKKLMGHWLLEADGNRTKVTQQLFVDPEGSLPPLIINSLLIKGPYKTFSELHKAVGE